MLSKTKCVIYEKSKIIPIEQPSYNKELSSPKGEYSLKQNFFDPSKSSPPNEFMLKLYMRMNKLDLQDSNDNNFDKEYKM
jgi:hypothetical protein